jgi:hypothetical protein
MIYELKMPLPPTMNEIINTARSGWQPSNKLKKQWTNKIANFVKNCGFTLNDKIWIEFHWYLRNFGRDADNTAAAAKFIMDGLVSAKAIRNDNLTVIQSPVVHYYHRCSGNDVVIIRLSPTPEFLLDNFLLSNNFPSTKLEQYLLNS